MPRRRPFLEFLSLLVNKRAHNFLPRNCDGPTFRCAIAPKRRHEKEYPEAQIGIKTVGNRETSWLKNCWHDTNPRDSPVIALIRGRCSREKQLRRCRLFGDSLKSMLITRVRRARNSCMGRWPLRFSSGRPVGIAQRGVALFDVTYGNPISTVVSCGELFRKIELKAWKSDFFNETLSERPIVSRYDQSDDASQHFR